MPTYIPPPLIEELLQRTDIVELINAYLPLTKKGNSYLACCPFHDDRKPSFSVHASRQCYRCFSCEASGNAISFMMRYENLEFLQAVEKLAARIGLALPMKRGVTQKTYTQAQDDYQLLQAITTYYQQQLCQHAVSGKARAYLKQRGIERATIETYQLGFAPPGWEHLLQRFSAKSLLSVGMVVAKEEGKYYDRYRNRVMFPICDWRGRVVGFGGRVMSDEDTPKYLNSPETRLFHKRRELYGLYQALTAQKPLSKILIVEGYTDVIALANQGISWAVATLGTATSVDHMRNLIRHTQHIIFCFDGDQAGRAAAWRALILSLSFLGEGLQVQFLFLPDGEDPDSLLKKEGPDLFLQRVSCAVNATVFFFGKLQEGIDLSLPTGRTKLVAEASQYLAKLPEGTFRYAMLEELAKLVHIHVDRLETMVLHPKKQVQHIEAPTKVLALTPLRLTIVLLLQHPTLIKQFDNIPWDMRAEGPEETILKRLIDLLRTHTGLTTAGLLEYWREDTQFSMVAQCAIWQHHVPSDGIEGEFMGLLQHLKRQQNQQAIELLLHKRRTKGLDTTEITRLQRLIRQKHEQVQES